MVVDKRSARQAFSQRLGEALARLGVPDDHKRRKWVSKTFGVSVESARKWLGGEAMPDTARLEGIAHELRVSAAWLLSGEPGTAQEIRDERVQYRVGWQHEATHADLLDALDRAYELGTLTPALSSGIAAMLKAINLSEHR